MESITNTMKYEKRLSVIVPVYNVENYLERCIDSLLCQDIPHDEYEIILVNDGSTDSSYNIAKRLAEENNNIILLTQKNQGASVARNTGLEHVHGKYVFFVDSDDYLKDNSLGGIVAVAESNKLDICIFKCLAKWSDDTLHNIGYPFEKNKVFTGEQMLLQGYLVSAVWNCLYLVDLIRRNNISFYPGMVHEDVVFNHRIYPLAQRVMLVDFVCYYYCINPDSVSRGTNPAKLLRLRKSDVDVVAQFDLASKSCLYSYPIRTLLARKGNSITSSLMFSLIRDKMLSRNDKMFCLNYAKSHGVYPIHGKTLSWKTTLLTHLLNQEWFLKRLLR